MSKACSVSEVLESMSFPASQQWALDSLRQSVSFKRGLIAVLQDLSDGLSSILSTRVKLREGQGLEAQSLCSGLTLSFKVISDGLEVWFPQELVMLAPQANLGPEAINATLRGLELRHPFFSNSPISCIESVPGTAEPQAPRVQIPVTARLGSDCFHLWFRLSAAGVRRLSAYGKSSVVPVPSVTAKLSLDVRAELRIPLRSLACVQKLLPGARFRLFEAGETGSARGVLWFGQNQNASFAIRECINENDWLCLIEEKENAIR